jgi:pimeloyl-ACP methyl ester carboxylesterase
MQPILAPLGLGVPTFVAFDGTPLHYELSGTGRTVVVLPGGAARHPSYLGDLAGLPGTRATPHLRGVGQSPPPSTPEAGSYWNQAADVEAFRKHLGLTNLTLVAHSAGTRLAIAYAAQYPDRVNRMLLITPPAGYLVQVPSDADEISAARRGEPAFDAALAALSAMPRPGATHEEFTAWQETTAPAGYAAWTAKEQAHAKVGRWYVDAVFAYFSVTPPADLPDRLTRLYVPVRIIAGAQDHLTGLAPVLAMAKLFPKGEAVVLDQCGHYPWLEQPAAFRQAADDFLTT